MVEIRCPPRLRQGRFFMAICIVAVGSRTFSTGVGFPAKALIHWVLFCSGPAPPLFATLYSIFCAKRKSSGRCSVCREWPERLRPALRAVAGGGRGFGDIGHVAAGIAMR